MEGDAVNKLRDSHLDVPGRHLVLANATHHPGIRVITLHDVCGNLVSY